MKRSAFVCQQGNHVVENSLDRYVVALEARRHDSMHRLFRIVVAEFCKQHAEEFERDNRPQTPDTTIPMFGREGTD